MTRVLMTADAVGGVWTYALELISALGPDVEVTLAVTGPQPEAQHRVDARAVGVAELYHRPYALEWMPDAWNDVDATTAWLLELAAEIHPHVVHLNSYCSAAAAWPCPVVVVAHSDVVTWWQAVHACWPGDEWAEYVRRVRAGLHAADVVVGPTSASLAALARVFGVSGVTIPNGRTAAWVLQCAKEPIVLGVGRLWDEAKNVAALARAATALEWPVLLAGEPAGPDGSRHPLPDVQLLGQLSFADLAGWLNRAAVFASPARYEPFGLGALEGALAGCALVLGDIPTFREIWDGVALFVDPDDDAQLARALDALAHHPVRCRELGEIARARGAELTPRRMADGYRRIYRSLRAVTPATVGGAPR